MPALIAVMLAGAISTAEFCAEPIAGGREEPDFCRVSTPQRIDTPFFAIVVDSDVLIGVDQNGRRIMIQFSPRQNQAGLLIQAIPLDEVASVRKSLSGVHQYLSGQLSCERRTLGAQLQWEWCVPDEWRERYLSQYYFVRTGTDLYYVDRYASESGREMDAVVSRVLESLVANGI
jgi:hypothetical protein